MDTTAGSHKGNGQHATQRRTLRIATAPWCLCVVYEHWFEVATGRLAREGRCGTGTKGNEDAIELWYTILLFDGKGLSLWTLEFNFLPTPG